MANRRVKMERTARAKQFLPFDALSGFREALEEKEQIRVSKRELSEEQREAFDGVLKTIRKKDVVLVEFFQNGEYTEIMGMVSGIQETKRVLEVAHTEIPFDAITKLELKTEEG